MITRCIFSILLIAALVCMTGCGLDSDRITIEAAAAQPINPTGTLGGMAEPDNFRIYAVVSTPRDNNGKAGDEFRSSFSVGVAGDISKYGSISGLKFVLVTDWQMWIAFSDWFDQAVGPPKPDRRYYFAVSDPAQIRCNDQNKLIFSVSGEGSDNLQMHLSTVEMHGRQLQVKQSPTRQGSMAFINGAGSLQYRCGEVEVP